MISAGRTLPGALYLLPSPGCPGSAWHVDRVQGGAGVRVHVRGEVVKLRPPRGLRLEVIVVVEVGKS